MAIDQFLVEFAIGACSRGRCIWLFEHEVSQKDKIAGDKLNKHSQ